MSDKQMTKDEWHWSCFAEAFKGIPKPIPMFDDGAVCPWCGELHATVSVGSNECNSCQKIFIFGYPDKWPSTIKQRPESFVDFPYEEWKLLGAKPSLVPEWKPSERLKEIHDDVDAWLADLSGEEPAPEGATIN
ncbi:hypothetical protein PsAD5_00140 [Pseudovibrio sp. Ad5]|uniref:hypothetical protein n=1 Tax=Pseudovibrio sp. Ad5 TaxID=989436 RepID=UPI0007AE6CEA|nr:hypothetical protein [Pseudovibrio sp. Ad5]KZL02191.1 hypothetical protein PsAD5_00140 [Pseudovibrio sp. Ad5]